MAHKNCTSIINLYSSVYSKARHHVAKTTSPSHPQKQSLSFRHSKALAYIPSARSSLLLQHMARKAREGCQPVRQTSSLPGPPADGSVGHVSRGEQKAQTSTTSQQFPGTASVCEGLTEQGSYDRVPRINGVEADRSFSRMPRGNNNIYVLYFDAQIGIFFRLRDRG